MRIMEIEKKKNSNSKSENSKCRFCNCHRYVKPNCEAKELQYKLEKLEDQVVGVPTGKEVREDTKSEINSSANK